MGITQKGSPGQPGKDLYGILPFNPIMPLRTPLHRLQEAAGATFFEFAGWEMPLQFRGIVAEHHAVRQGAGLFDVSHMGKIVISGPNAMDLLTHLSSNKVPQSAWRSRYTFLLDDEGQVIDDVIVTCLAPNRFLVVCNAGPRKRVLSWLGKHSDNEVVRDVTMDFLCLALQGPKAARVLQLLTQWDVDAIKPFAGAHIDLLLGERLGTGRTPKGPPSEVEGWVPFADSPLRGLVDSCLVTRTGYTGEDGFEMFPPRELAEAMWNATLAAGREARLEPVGLGARDTLRLEKGYLLSGTDFDGRQTPLECGGERFIRWDHEFVGRDALVSQRARGDYDRLVGLRMLGKVVPRHGCEVYHGGTSVGIVTSGTSSPTLKGGIALARVRPAVASEGTGLDVLIRDRPHPAIVVPLPFL